MKNTKNSFRGLFVLALFVSVLLCAALLLSGCGNKEKNEELKAVTERMLDGIIEKDGDAVYGLLKNAYSREQSDAFLDSASKYIDGVTAYELKQTGWHWNLNNGVESYTATFSMTSADGRRFEVNTVSVEGYEGIVNFNITEVKSGGISDAPWLIPLQIAGIAFTLVCTAFTVWMIVDCAKRRMSKKALWIIIILLGIVGKVAFSAGGFDINASVSLAVPITRASMGGGVVAMQLAIPVGAIVYFCMRKRLSLPAPDEYEE